MLQLLKRLLGSKNERDVQNMLPIVEEINEECEKLAELSDDELRGRTESFRSRIHEAVKPIEDEMGSVREILRDSTAYEEHESHHARLDELNKQMDEKIEEVLKEILPEAFAVVKDACRRLVGQTWEVAGNKIMWDMVPFDVQLMGGVVLHEGKIAEMATGEGKTLVATLPAYLNALPGRGVHIVTVNDYLAQRDSQWMGRVFEFLGLRVGVILSHMDPQTRRNN